MGCIIMKCKVASGDKMGIAYIVEMRSSMESEIVQGEQKLNH